MIVLLLPLVFLFDFPHIVQMELLLDIVQIFFSPCAFILSGGVWKLEHLSKSKLANCVHLVKQDNL